MAHAVARAALGSIPVAGAVGVELFAYLVEEPLQRRREDWMREVGDAIADLRDRRGVDVEALRSDPKFGDTVLHATHAALRTQESVNREALRNAVLNSALPSAPEAAVRRIFIRLVDECTPWHLRLLDLFDDPTAWQRRNGRSFPPPPHRFSLPIHLIDQAFPDLRSHPGLYNQCWKDLHHRGLVAGEELHALFMQYDLYQSQSTELGRQFLKFTRSPE